MRDHNHAGLLLKLNRSAASWSETTVKHKQVRLEGHFLCYQHRGAWRGLNERINLHKVASFRRSTIPGAPTSAFDIEMHADKAGRRRVFTFGPEVGVDESMSSWLWLCCSIVPRQSVEASLLHFCKGRSFLAQVEQGRLSKQDATAAAANRIGYCVLRWWVERSDAVARAEADLLELTRSGEEKMPDLGELDAALNAMCDDLSQPPAVRAELLRQPLALKFQVRISSLCGLRG